MSECTQAAGGVVINPNRKVAVVSQHRNSWSQPKGHVEKGETLLQAAMREIEEETGIPRVDLGHVKILGSYVRGRIAPDGVGEIPGEMRQLTIFLFTTRHTGPLIPHDPENPEARWVAPEMVASLLTHPKDKSFFEGVRDSLNLQESLPS